MLKKITSLGNLRALAAKDPAYAKRAIVAASNLGGPAGNLESALRHLTNEAMETSEEGVVDEINFCRDLV